MSAIEKLIVQKKFKSEYQKSMISLMYTANMINDLQADFFKPYKITRQQYNALRILKGQYPEPSTVGLIKERLIDKNSDASRMVDRLCKSDLVERIVSKTDRRASDVKITKKGLRLLEKLDDKIEEFENPIRVITKKEAELLNSILNKILKKNLETK